MILGFTGTTKGMTDAQHRVVREFLLSQADRITETHNGGATGVDLQCFVMTREFLPTELDHIWPSSYHHGGPLSFVHELTSLNRVWIHEPLPPLERNHEIVNHCTDLLACPGEMTEQLRSGTWATIRYARKTRTPIWFVFPDGSTLLEVVT